MTFSTFLGVAFLVSAVTCFINSASPSKRKRAQSTTTGVFATVSDINENWADGCCPTLGDCTDHLLAGEAASKTKLLKAKPNARVRLFCAYGVADTALSLRSWIQDAPEWLEVRILELPGHGYLAKEQDLPPCSYYQQSVVYSNEELKDQLNKCIVQELADQMEPLLYNNNQSDEKQEPICYAFYGFSWGAMVTYELCLEMERRNHHLPVLLVAAGRGAPNAILYSDDFSKELQRYSDPQLLAFVQDSMGFPMDRVPSKRVTRVASLFRCGMVMSGIHAGTSLNNNDVANNSATTPRHVWEDIQAPILRSTENVPLLNCPIVSLGASEDEIWPNQHVEFWSEATSRMHKHIYVEGLTHDQLMNAPTTKHTLFEELAHLVTKKCKP